jgi:hypothetical protein
MALGIHKHSAELLRPRTSSLGSSLDVDGMRTTVSFMNEAAQRKLALERNLKTDGLPYETLRARRVIIYLIHGAI